MNTQEKINHYDKIISEYTKLLEDAKSVERRREIRSIIRDYIEIVETLERSETQ